MSAFSLLPSTPPHNTSWFSRKCVFSGALMGLLLLFLASGCEDSTLSHTSHQTQSPDDPSSNNSTPNTPGDPNDPSEPPKDGCCIMVPLGGERSLEVDQFGQVVVGVGLFERESGEPRPGELIEFNLLDDSGGASLTERSAVTTEDGTARIRFRGGEELQSYIVRASTSEANFIEFSIEVKMLPTGNLDVRFVNAGASVYEVAPIQTYAFPRSEFDCAQFRPLAALPDTVYGDEVRNVERRASFEGLDTRETWSVVALGIGEFGQTVAAGCLSGVFIQEDQTTEAEVVLTLLPLNPIGRYEVTSYWDFTETLENSGTVGQVLTNIFDAFENPGRFFYDQLINIVNSFLGGFVSGAVDFFLDVFGLDDRIESGINNFIESVDFLSRIRQAGLDLRDVVTNLEVISTLTIGKLGNDYEVYGADDWRGLAVYWRWNCDEDSPPDCGRIELAFDDESSLQVVYGEWTGQVAAYNNLQIRTHSISLRYGQLILYILNEVILPALTDGNAHSLVDALLYWINCEGLGYAITGSDGELCAPADIVCIEAEDIASVCDSSIRFAFNFLEVLLASLEVDSVIELSGQAKLVERDGDLLIDEMIEGEYSGWVNFDGSRSPFTAEWTATRIVAEPDPEPEPEVDPEE